jgi:hypothetical protein
MENYFSCGFLIYEERFSFRKVFKSMCGVLTDTAEHKKISGQIV